MKLKKAGELALQAGIVLLALLTVLAWTPTPFWLLNLTSHFMVHFLVLQLLLGLGLLGLRGSHWQIWLLVLGLSSLPQATQLLPYWLPPSKPATDGPHLKLLHLNVYAPNRRFAEIAALIARFDPDVIDLMEYTEASRRGLEATGVFRTYPYRFTGKAHLGLYSRLPLRQTELVYVGPERVANFAQLRTRIQLSQEQLTLILAHPQLPFGKHYANQGLHFASWIREREDYGANLIIAGDLNTTPWSPHFRKLIAKTDLRDSQKGFGIQPSWPAWAPLLGIPIDHVLLSRRLQARERKVGPDVGSDHLPVFVDIALTQPD